MKPIYTQLYEQKKYMEFKKVVQKMILLSSSFAIALAIILLIVNRFVLSLYGEGYIGYSSTYIIMIITSVFMCIQSQFGNVFQAIGEIWKCLILNMFWAILFIILFFILNQYSTIGYASTYLISYMLYSLISYLVFYHTTKQKFKSEECKNEIN